MQLYEICCLVNIEDEKTKALLDVRQVFHIIGSSQQVVKVGLNPTRAEMQVNDYINYMTLLLFNQIGLNHRGIIKKEGANFIFILHKLICNKSYTRREYCIGLLNNLKINKLW